jgi:RimJ/RimL family protein N-acetyltransferase
MSVEIWFRPLERADLEMMHVWLQRPHVAQWWTPTPTPAQLEDDYFPAESTTTRACIAMLRDEPLGFIQCYTAMGSGDGWWEEERDPGVRGVDQFLANAQQLGQGYGSAMVRKFVDAIFADAAVTKVQTDPSPDNERAIRAYRKAGFTDHSRIMTPDGPALLMVRLRA